MRSKTSAQHGTAAKWGSAEEQGSTRGLMELQTALWQHCPSLSVSAFFGFWHIPPMLYSTYFGNISQDKKKTKHCFRGPVVRGNSVGFIRGCKCSPWQRTHKNVYLTTQSYLLTHKSPPVYITPLIIHCSSALSVMLLTCIYLLIYKKTFKMVQFVKC